MSIAIKKEIDTFSELREQTWCCDFVLDAIEKANKENDFMEYLEEIYFMSDEEIPTMTELNDYIRFDYEEIFEALGLDEGGNEPEEEEEEYEA